MLDNLAGAVAHAAILALLALGGVGLPVPEEATQLTAGFLARQGRIGFPAALVTCYGGILAGDFLLFQLGRRLGPRVMELAPVARLLTPRRRRSIEAHYARHAALTVMAGRYASGLRLPFFALAGASGVPARTFLLADAFAALLSVPAVVGLGWHFASRLEEAQASLRLPQLALAGVALLALAAAVLRRRRRERDAGAPPPERDAGAPPPGS